MVGVVGRGLGFPMGRPQEVLAELVLSGDNGEDRMDKEGGEDG